VPTIPKQIGILISRQAGVTSAGATQTGRNWGLKKPEALSEQQARQPEWDSIADILKGRGHRKRTKARHTTASGRIARMHSHKNPAKRRYSLIASP